MEPTQKKAPAPGAPRQSMTAWVCPRENADAVQGVLLLVRLLEVDISGHLAGILMDWARLVQPSRPQSRPHHLVGEALRKNVRPLINGLPRDPERTRQGGWVIKQ